MSTVDVTVRLDADTDVWQVRSKFPAQVHVSMPGGAALLIVRHPAAARQLAHELLVSADLVERGVTDGAA